MPRVQGQLDAREKRMGNGSDFICIAKKGKGGTIVRIFYGVQNDSIAYPCVGGRTGVFPRNDITFLLRIEIPITTVHTHMSSSRSISCSTDKYFLWL